MLDRGPVETGYGQNSKILGGMSCGEVRVEAGHCCAHVKVMDRWWPPLDALMERSGRESWIRGRESWMHDRESWIRGRESVS